MTTLNPGPLGRYITTDHTAAPATYTLHVRADQFPPVLLCGTGPQTYLDPGRHHARHVASSLGEALREAGLLGVGAVAEPHGQQVRIVAFGLADAQAVVAAATAAGIPLVPRDMPLDELLARDVFARVLEHHELTAVFDHLSEAEQAEWVGAAVHAIESAVDDIITAGRPTWWHEPPDVEGRRRCLRATHTGPPCGPYCVLGPDPAAPRSARVPTLDAQDRGGFGGSTYRTEE
jgi:hypothetical protein